MFGELYAKTEYTVSLFQGWRYKRGSTVFYPLSLSLSLSLSLLQTYACLSRLKAQLRQLPQEVASQPNSTIFFERSVHSDKSATVTDSNTHASVLHSYCV